MDAIKLSLGKIRTFLQCPLKYKLANIDQVSVRAKASAGLSFYQALHNALEYFHKAGTTPLPSEEFLLNLLDRNWDHSGYKDAGEETQYRGLAENILKTFYKSYSPEKHDVKYLSLMVKAKTKKCFISSRVDRVDLLPDGTYEVINYKTGKNVLEPSELARDTQAVILYLGANAHKRLEGKVSKVSFYYLRANRKISVTPTPDDIKEVTDLIDQTAANIVSLEKGKSAVLGLLEKILPAAKKISGGVDDPKALAEKGALCNSCEYLEACPAWPLTPREIAGETPEVFSDRIRLSYSKLSSYKRCPRAWKNSYLEGKFSREPKPFFSFGLAIHEAFENYYDPHGSKKSSLKHLLGLWDEAFNNHAEGYRDEKEKISYYNKGVEQITKYYQHYCANGKYRPAYAIEDYFEVPLGKNAVMVGFIDRIDKLDDGTFEILDYKTEPTRRTQKAADEDDQLTIYFWACETLFKMKIKQLSLLMTNFDERLITTRKAADFPEVVAAIDAVAAEMKENVKLFQENYDPDQEESIYFPPKKNKYCKSCDFLETCLLKPEIMGDTTIRTMEYTDTDREELLTSEYE
ncbi:MAG: PD-(D/E)XK nuclease family protein [Candidatus Euphemobacter frigidus]|nr:PD-(D/E)XK nuclease family protein [Candidatus Euphemobacter frigidus]MDP8275459.1 PD-(D/E)XK nuclease family protein [Candidatus Euphemobacter frigidus]